MYDREYFGCDHRTITTARNVEWNQYSVKANAISNMIHSCFMLEMPKLPFETVHTINLLARCGDLSRYAVLRVGPRTLKL